MHAFAFACTCVAVSIFHCTFSVRHLFKITHTHTERHKRMHTHAYIHIQVSLQLGAGGDYESLTHRTLDLLSSAAPRKLSLQGVCLRPSELSRLAALAKSLESLALVDCLIPHELENL